MNPRDHGGDWAAYQETYHREPLDFSANVSPIGPPAGVREAICRAAGETARYPDPHCRRLRRALAEHHGADPEEILCGNGASDLLDRLALALRPKRGLVTAPAFSEYAQVLRRVGCRVEDFPLDQENDFAITPALLETITPDLDILFLCEPSNPAGRCTEKGLLLSIAAKCDACGVLLVVDECFEDFLTDRTHSLIPDLADHHLLILRAFTKFYGLAGVRLGYCLSRETGLLAAMAAAGQPWPVSNLAQAAGIAALKERGYGETLRTLITTQRQFLSQGLTALGCQVVPGEANYLLFRAPTQDLGRRLAHRGILLRSCANYTGLDAHWFRTAVRGAEENALLLEAIKEALP